MVRGGEQETRGCAAPGSQGPLLYPAGDPGPPTLPRRGPIGPPITKIYPPPRLRRDGVRRALPVRATSFLSSLLYLSTFVPVKGPEIGGPLKIPPTSGPFPHLLKPRQNPSKISCNLTRLLWKSDRASGTA